MGLRAGLATGAAALIVAGCADHPPSPRSVELSRAEWQSGSWPFTVNAGVLTCHAPDWVTFTANGIEYARTDDARWLGHYQNVEAVKVQGYVEIGDERLPVPAPLNPELIERGRKLCQPTGAERRP